MTAPHPGPPVNVPSTPANAVPVHAKVPALVAAFWVVKVLTTGLGESASDYMVLGHHWILIGLSPLAFVAAIVWQLRTTRYQAIPYWSTVTGVAVFGTVAADIVMYAIGVPVPLVVLAYAGLTALVLVRWYRSEQTLSVHSITTRRRERFYWLTVMSTFSLGTAAGDLTATGLGLGFRGSIVLFGIAITVPWILHRRGHLHPVTAFWAAYILTRPLGASVADWLAMPVHKNVNDLYGVGGGLGFGSGPVSLAGVVLVVILVAYLAIRRPDVQSAIEWSGVTAARGPSAW